MSPQSCNIVEGEHALPQLRAVLPREVFLELQSGRDLLFRNRMSRADHLATGIVALDEIFEGGLPRGELIEITGRVSSGRFSLALQMLAGVTSQGENAAFIDPGDHLDPQAAEAGGVVLERLLWVRPRTFRDSLIAAEIAVSTGFALVLLDLGMGNFRCRPFRETAPWLRLSRTALAQGAALVVLSPYRMSGSAARHVLDLTSPRSCWTGEGGSVRLLAGLSSGLLRENKNKPCLYRRLELSFR